MDLRRSLPVALFVLVVCGPGRAHAQQVAPAPALTPDAVQVENSPAELEAIRPLLDRGIVVLARAIDMAESSSATAFVHVNAPPSVVHEFVANPARYRESIPWVVGADELSHRNGRAAYRLHLRVASFDIDAMLTLRMIGANTVEATVHQDSVGSGYARWDVLPAPDGGTLLRLTVHTALEPDSFLVRLATGASRESYTFGNIASAVALALHVKRGSEHQVNAATAVRDPVTDANQPPPDGPWLDIARRTNVLFVGLDAHGDPVQELALGATWTRASQLRDRVAHVTELPNHLPWFSAVRLIAQDPARITYASRLGAPFARGIGETRVDLDPDGRVVRLTGLNGDFAGEHNRWDFVERDLTFMMSTGSTVERHFTVPQRALIASDPLVGTGLSLAWRVLTLRWFFAGG